MRLEGAAVESGRVFDLPAHDARARKGNPAPASAMPVRARGYSLQAVYRLGFVYRRRPADLLLHRVLRQHPPLPPSRRPPTRHGRARVSWLPTTRQAGASKPSAFGGIEEA